MRSRSMIDGRWCVKMHLTIEKLMYIINWSFRIITMENSVLYKAFESDQSCSHCQAKRLMIDWNTLRFFNYLEVMQRPMFSVTLHLSCKSKQVLSIFILYWLFWNASCFYNIFFERDKVVPTSLRRRDFW